MLLAEIHGKSLEVARNSEDYLTSAVFGHLRYIAPSLFWDNLFQRAKGLSDSDGRETLLGSLLTKADFLPSQYSQLQTNFWKQHIDHGEPDLILVFSGSKVPPLVVIIEVKLWAAKSGIGENDQLVRYLRILDDLSAVGIFVPQESRRYLIYLTPHESIAELLASAESSDNRATHTSQLFRLQWQDVLEAANETSQQYHGAARLVLEDVVSFLREFGLEYFRGMSRLNELDLFDTRFNSFYRSEVSGFRGLFHEPGFVSFETRNGLWT